MYSANRFPVLVYDRDARAAYKGGGLAAKAQDVADAGRFSDTKIIHVTDDEFNMLRNQWGEPTVNPHTGMHEFGIFGTLLKIGKMIAPIAATAIGGPLAGAAVGAGLGALDGGGIKGALLGGVTGGLGGGGAGGIGAKLGTSVLGANVAPRLAQALGSGAISAAANAALGGDPLMGGLGTALGNYMRNPMAKTTTAAPTTTSTTAAPTTVSAPTTVDLPTSAPSLLDRVNASVTRSPYATLPSLPTPSTFSVSPATQAAVNIAAPATATTAATTAAAPNFWNKDFLGLGVVKNKYAIPGIIGAAALADALAPKEDTSMPSKADFFGPAFGSALGGSGGFRLASRGPAANSSSATKEYADKYFSGYADGGDVEENHGNFAVRGPGTGRSDDIPAMLSDGEYVMDAETVSMLGDGSTKAGAKKLDDFRIKIRKQKGSKLAKGKISHDAKAPEKYMAGGRI